MIEAMLTPEQRRFAAEHHSLVYSFLRLYRLDESDFYDVVVFGYIKAAKEYLSNAKLRRNYAFSTIAFRKMKDALHRHRENQNRQKRKAVIVSLDAARYGESETLSLHEMLYAPDTTMLDFETELLMLELAARVSRQEMRIVRMKADGYSASEIAKTQHMSVKGVVALLAGLRETLHAICAR